MTRRILIAWSVCLAIGTRDAARAAEQRFTLHDRINHAWANELVHYELSFGPGECWAGGIRLSDGAGQPVPAQLADVTTHADGGVAKATVWFMASVPPNTSVTYHLAGGKKRDRPARYESDLLLSKEKDSVVLATSKIGVRVLLGEKRFATPEPAERLPGPLQGVRLRSGEWTGRGWIETKHLCTGYSATVSDDGPVFKQVAIRYSFLRPERWERAEDPYYRMIVRVAAGQEIAYVTEEYNLGDPKVYQPPYYADKMEESLWGWWGAKPHETPDNACFSFHGPAFSPTHARTIGPGVSSPDKGPCPNGGYAENEYPLKYDKDRFEFTVTAWVGWQVDQSQIYTMYSPDRLDSDVVSLFGCHAGNWRQPDVLPHDPAFIRQFTDSSPLRIYTSAKPDVFVRGPLNLGRREWALAVLKNPGVVTQERNLTPIAALTRKHGFLPLDKVKDWILDWPRSAKYPRLFTEPGNMEAVRARIKLLPQLEASVRNTGWGRWVIDGKEDALKGTYTTLIERLDLELRDALGWPNGAGERTSINGYPWGMQEKSALADTLLGSGKLTEEQKTALLSRMAFMAYLLRDPNYLPPRPVGFGWGSANMPVNVGGARAMTASLLADHPMSAEWLKVSIEYFGFVVRRYYGEDGSPTSSPAYMGTEAGPVVTVVLALQHNGLLGDVCQAFPNLHKYGRYMVDLMPPKDVRFGHRILPTIGDTARIGNAFAGQFAGLFRQAQPDLAGELMWTWTTSGLPLAGFINAGYFLDTTVPPQPAQLKSVAYPGFGAFLRSAAGTEQESYVSVRFGTFTYDHMHNETGSYHWYAKGVPLSLDWGSVYSPWLLAPFWHSTLSFDHREDGKREPCPGRDDPKCFYTGKQRWFDHKHEPDTALSPILDPEKAQDFTELFGHIAAFTAQPGVDYVRGEIERKWFERTPYFMDPEEGPATPWAPFTRFERIQLAHPFPWTRQTLFVKDDTPGGHAYLVVADHLTGNQELEPAFNFWCMAKEVKQDGRHVHFTGQYGVDLEMFVLEPNTGRIQTGEYSVDRLETQKLVRIYGKPGSGFRVVLYPRKPEEPEPTVEAVAAGKLVKVALPDQTHWVFASGEKVSVTEAQFSLTGTAAVIKQFNDGRALLSLLAPGKIEYGKAILESPTAASLEVKR